mgnify:CR=1 FL=1
MRPNRRFGQNLRMTQQEALDILKMGYSAYVTGEAGTGKTYVLNEYISWLRAHDIDAAVTASTGIAATHLGGSTIHSWSGIGVRDFLTSFDLDSMEQKKNLWRRYENVRVLIIDEISMLSGDFMDMCDKVCRHMKRNNKPFGGVQTVFSGDFFQLPPIGRDAERRPAYAFQSRSWGELAPVTCYLTEQHRQSDATFASLLSAIRARSDNEGVRKALVEREKISPPKNYELTRLFTHNVDVDALNEERLGRLKEKAQVFEMQAKGRKQYVEQLMRGCLAPEVLRLKKGAEVMFVKNDQAGSYVNGTQGIVVGFAPDKAPVVRTRAGRKIYATPQSWRREEDGKVLAEITQIPLRLAWAITVHKSQGMTLDAAEIDLGRSFVPGQGYVALSRVRELSGLYLRAFNETALAVDERVAACDRQFREHSRGASKRLTKIGKEEIKKRQDKFIVACGGSVAPIPETDREKPKVKERIPTKDQTRRLFEKNLTIKEAASKRGLALSTIISHAEDLLKQGVELDFSYLAPRKNIQTVLAKAIEKQGKQGFDYLSTIKIYLGKQGHNISYDKLREMRLYIWSQRNNK